MSKVAGRQTLRLIVCVHVFPLRNMIIWVLIWHCVDRAALTKEDLEHFEDEEVRKGLRFPRIPPPRLEGGELRQGSLPRSRPVCVCVCLYTHMHPGSVFMKVHLRRGCFRCHGKFLYSSHSVSTSNGLSLGWSHSRGPLFHSYSGRPLPCLSKIKSLSVFVLWKHQRNTSAK